MGEGNSGGGGGGGGGNNSDSRYGQVRDELNAAGYNVSADGRSVRSSTGQVAGENWSGSRRVDSIVRSGGSNNRPGSRGLELAAASTSSFTRPTRPVAAVPAAQPVRTAFNAGRGGNPVSLGFDAVAAAASRSGLSPSSPAVGTRKFAQDSAAPYKGLSEAVGRGPQLSYGNQPLGLTAGTRLSYDTALGLGPRSADLVPGVDVAARPPRLDAGYSTPSVQPNRYFDTTAAMARPALEAVGRNISAIRSGGVRDIATNVPMAALNLADAVVRGGAGLAADLTPGGSFATERAQARGLMALPEAFMGVSPGRVTNVLDDALERVTEAGRIRDLGQRVAADQFISRFPSDQIGTFEGAFAPTPAQNVELMQRANSGLLTANETDYLNRMGVASQLESQGVGPRSVFEQTGILSVPTRTVTGDLTPGGRTLSFTTTPTPGGQSTAAIDRVALNEVLEQGRTARLRDLMGLPENLRGGVFPAAATRAPVSAEALPQGVSGGFDPVSGRIALSSSGAERAGVVPTLRHETGHLYLRESDIPPRAVGTSPEMQAQQAQRALGQIDVEVSAAERDRAAGLIDDFQLQEVRDAAAAQRSSLLRSPMELYSENLGEIIARRAEGDTSQYVTAGLREAFNPYIPTSSGIRSGAPLSYNVQGAIRAPIEQGLFTLRQIAGRPSAEPALPSTPVGPIQSYGIVAQVPSNIFTRSNTGSRAPTYVPPGFQTQTFDFDAFD